MIGLLGATGYTGKLVAAELASRRLPHRRGARDPEKLAALPAVAGAEPFVVDVGQRDRLDAFLDGLDAVINTVGPFVELGLPVVEACADAGVPYVDSTGETAFMAEVYERFADTTAPIVPACGFDVIPGDLAAAVAARDLGDVTEIAVHYHVRGVLPSRGTVRSTAGILAQGGIGSRRRRVAMPDGPRQAVEWSPGETVTVPRHVPGARVVATAVMPGPLAAAAERWGQSLLPRAAPLATWLADRLPEGPSESLRRRAHAQVMAEAFGPSGRRAVVTDTNDVYGMTARFLVEAALRARGRGALAPAEALEPEAFLDAVSGASDLGAFAWRRV